MLSSLGYSVTGVTDSRAALRMVEQNHEAFDVLVTDQTMPGMTGIELAEKALAIKPTLAVILCTGYSSSATPDRAAAAGIRKCLMKPLTRRDLGKAIREVLNAG